MQTFQTLGASILYKSDAPQSPNQQSQSANITSNANITNSNNMQQYCDSLIFQGLIDVAVVCGM